MHSWYSSIYSECYYIKNISYIIAIKNQSLTVYSMCGGGDFHVFGAPLQGEPPGELKQAKTSCSKIKYQPQFAFELLGGYKFQRDGIEFVSSINYCYLKVNLLISFFFITADLKTGYLHKEFTGWGEKLETVTVRLQILGIQKQREDGLPKEE